MESALTASEQSEWNGTRTKVAMQIQGRTVLIAEIADGQQGKACNQLALSMLAVTHCAILERLCYSIHFQLVKQHKISRFCYC
jgi:hypothetical protein